MAQLIVKSPYLPPNSTGKIEGYLRYISTREGVEQIKKKIRWLIRMKIEKI